MNNRNAYVQYGSHFCAPEGWLNFDSSPTLRIERIPVVGSLVSSLFSGNEGRFPKAVRYGDIRKGLPVQDGSVKACYASHVLEHLCLEDMRMALANTFKMLEPGGIFRMIVPDLHERARRYVAEADGGSSFAAATFLQSTCLGHEKRARTPLQHLRQAIGGAAHLWMWDEYALSAELARAGFINIRRCKFGDASDPMFSRVEARDRFFDEHYQIDECAIEARKPE